MKHLKKNWLIYAALLLSIVFFSWDDFVRPFIEVMPHFKQGTWFRRFSELNPEIWRIFYNRIKDFFVDAWQWLRAITLGDQAFDLDLFLLRLIERTNDLLVWIINVPLNFFMIGLLVVLIWLDFESYKVKETKAAIGFNKALDWTIRKSRWLSQYMKDYRIRNRRKINASIAIILFFNGWLMTLFFEAVIFIVYYVAALQSLKTIEILMTIVKSIVIAIELYIPLWGQVIIGIYLFFRFAKAMADSRMAKNYQDMKAFARYDLTFSTAVLGPPGIGKTRTLVSLALAIEDAFIEDIQDRMRSIEYSNPVINWGRFDMTRLAKDPSTKLDLDFLKKNFPEYLYLGICLYLRGTMITSAPFSIMDPFHEEHSVIFDWRWVRLKAEDKQGPLEPYTIGVISELDKEYSSHEDKEKVGSDGFHWFVGTGAHQTDRKGKFLFDWQVNTQVPLRIRANCEWILHIEDSKQKYPFFLRIFRKPFLIMFNTVDGMLRRREYYTQPLTRWTQRMEKAIRKNFSYTMLYAMLRHVWYGLAGIMDWFSHYDYRRYDIIREDFEGKPVGKLKLYINAQDEQWRGRRLYDSTFLKAGYDKRREASIEEKTDLPPWRKLPRYTSLHPTDEELHAQHSVFIETAYYKKPEAKVAQDMGLADLVPPAAKGSSIRPDM